MCLLCRHHHRQFEQHDWTVTMLNGIPHWLPPPWLDPHQQPIRNTAHHLDDFDFAVGQVTDAVSTGA